jgi:hypothetical protein
MYDFETEMSLEALVGCPVETCRDETHFCSTSETHLEEDGTCYNCSY